MHCCSTLELDQSRRLRRCIFQHRQRGLDHRVLNSRIIGFAEWIPVREWNEQRPRRAHAYGDLAQELNGHSGDALTFQFGSDQAYGLITEWSDGYQQGHVDGVGNQLPRHRRRAVPHQAPGRGDRAHERQMTVVH